MKRTDVDLDAMFKRLHLASARRIWRDLVARAEKESWTFHEFLSTLVCEEIAQRQQTRVQRLSRRALFPFLKTIDDFDFTHQSTLRLALLGSALSPDFVTDGRSLILTGKPGRGKTHLAVAIAYRAIQNGFDALFVTAAELIDHLSSAFREGRLAADIVRYTTPAVLVVDEVGYLTYGTDAANLLFHVVNDRHRNKRSMIFTTNKPLKQWGRVLHDDDLAHAILDRILERGRVLQLDGPSMRTRHLGLDDPLAAEASTQPDRISGITPAEFPEPTTRTGAVCAARRAAKQPRDHSSSSARSVRLAALQFERFRSSGGGFTSSAAQERRSTGLGCTDEKGTGSSVRIGIHSKTTESQGLGGSSSAMSTSGSTTSMSGSTTSISGCSGARSASSSRAVVATRFRASSYCASVTSWSSRAASMTAANFANAPHA